MKRMILILVATGALSACAQYREPQANCFGFLPFGQAALDCDFAPLGGPENTGERHE